MKTEIERIRDLYSVWKKKIESKYLSFSSFDAFLEGYQQGLKYKFSAIEDLHAIEDKKAQSQD